MTGSNTNPRLAALRSLEESLLSHRRAQAPQASAGAEAPTPGLARRLAGSARAAPFKHLSFKHLSMLLPIRRRGLRHCAIALATVVALVAMAFGGLWYRL